MMCFSLRSWIKGPMISNLRLMVGSLTTTPSLVDFSFGPEANNLAQQHSLAPVLSFNYNNIYNPSFALQYKQCYIEQPTRRTIKNICNAHTISIWSSQHRMEAIIPISHQID
ncbi:hypothetical protein C2G38_2218607 [Gigaspora rosea]|uniref:Uncharacterized protein n=1 Tax=Gigaspora rosea TaxID=44941 RepID=A0A397UEV2_9GLOM|nr:hypothetical protein C2G38_2218607 [Gigaspora rosea]